MDYVVHINDGGEGEARPIILRLLPGEETIFNLKIVNHGEPSNITLVASDPVFKAVRLKKPGSYVVLEETVPVMTRMPTDVSRLEGEIVLTSSGGTSRVPIRLLREAEDPGDDLEEETTRVEAEPWDDLRRDDLNGDRDLDGGGIERADESSSDDEDQRFKERRPETEEDDEPEDERTEARPIRFSRQRDVESYRAASRPRRMEEIREEPAEERTEDVIEERPPSEERRDPREYAVAGQSYGRDLSYASREYVADPEVAPAAEAEEESYEEVKKGGFFDLFGGSGALQVIPLGILMALILVLVMTFFTETIPEFPGALASAILIVTLIIYGAATLLKA